MIERKIFILQCPKCEWRAFRDKHEGLQVCSQCGHKGQPIVWDSVLEVKENPYYKNLFKCAVEYTDDLLRGEKLEDVMERMDKCKKADSTIFEDERFDAFGECLECLTGRFKLCAMGSPFARDEETY